MHMGGFKLVKWLPLYLPLKLCLFLCPLFVSFIKWKFIRNSILSMTALGTTPSECSGNVNVLDMQSAQIHFKVILSRQDDRVITE